MKPFLKAVIASAIVTAAGSAQADAQAYDVNLNFVDNVGTASFNGTFDFDAGTLQLTNLQGTLTDTNGTFFLNTVYGTATGQVFDSNSTSGQVVDNLSNPAIDVSLVINNTTPTLDTQASTYSDATGSTYLFGTEGIGGGSAVISAVPLPSALPLLASGLMALGVFGRKRNQA